MIGRFGNQLGKLFDKNHFRFADFQLYKRAVIASFDFNPNLLHHLPLSHNLHHCRLVVKAIVVVIQDHFLMVGLAELMPTTWAKAQAGSSRICPDLKPFLARNTSHLTPPSLSL